MIAGLRTETALYGDLPNGFFDAVGYAEMAYEIHGFGVFIRKHWLNTAEPDFKKTSYWAELRDAFDTHPEVGSITLQIKRNDQSN